MEESDRDYTFSVVDLNYRLNEIKKAIIKNNLKFEITFKHANQGQQITIDSKNLISMKTK